MSLTPKRERFCQEYLVDLNATAAYGRTYPKATAETARRNGSVLLTNPDVAARIAALQAERAARTGVTADRVVRELARIAFLDPRRVMAWGPNGVVLRPSAELTEDEAAAVAECSEARTQAGGTVRLKLASKLDALDKLARHLGMYVDRVKVEQDAPGPPAEVLLRVFASDAARDFLADLPALADPGQPAPDQPGHAGQAGPGGPLADPAAPAAAEPAAAEGGGRADAAAGG